MKRRKYRGQPVDPTAEDAPEVFRQSMIEQFGNPDGAKLGGKRPGAGHPERLSLDELNEKHGLFATSFERALELKAIYPDLFAYADIVLEEKRILEFMRVLISRPSARVMWRTTVERYGRAMGVGYDKALPLYREAVARLDQSGTVAQLHAQVAQMAQHLIALGHESVARDGGSLASQRELRESLKFVAGLAGLGPKLTLELAQKTAGEPAPPPGDPRRGPWLQALRARMASGVGEIDAELEQGRDADALVSPAGALTMGSEPEKKRGDD